MRLGAVIVSFGAGGAASAAALAARLSGTAARIVVVENTPGAPAPALDGAEGIANGNRGGLAGAYNRALARLTDCDLVVFIDQDSDPAVLPAMLADPEVRALLARPDVAAVAPAYRDRATGLRGRPARLEGRWRVGHLPRDFDDIRRTTMVINSMTLWRRAALDRLGPYDERLGVDHIDTDMALRAQAAGLSVWIAGGHVFDHAIGVRRPWHALGRTFQTGGHAAERRRQIGRNTLILARRWGWRFPGFAALALARIGYEAAGIIAAEDDRLAKLRALTAGAVSGLFGPR